MPKGSNRLICRDFWKNHLVEIEDEGELRSLYFGSRSLQSRMSLINPHELILSYTRHMALALLINTNPQNILIIGIGAGSFIRFFNHHFPKSKIDAVDYSPQTIDAAKDYFQLPDNNQIAIYCTDGCVFLQDNNSKQYDLVLIDAFDDQGMAPTVYSELFFSLCSKALHPDGVVSCNLWSDDKVRLQEIKTILASHFKSSLYLPVPDRGNIVALAMPFDVPWSRICLNRKEIKSLSQRYNFNFRQLIQIAKRHNLSFSQRLNTLLS